MCIDGVLHTNQLTNQQNHTQIRNELWSVANEICVFLVFFFFFLPKPYTFCYKYFFFLHFIFSSMYEMLTTYAEALGMTLQWTLFSRAFNQALHVMCVCVCWIAADRVATITVLLAPSTPHPNNIQIRQSCSADCCRKVANESEEGWQPVFLRLLSCQFMRPPVRVTFIIQLCKNDFFSDSFPIESNIRRVPNALRPSFNLKIKICEGWARISRMIYNHFPCSGRAAHAYPTDDRFARGLKDGFRVI